MKLSITWKSKDPSSPNLIVEQSEKQDFSVSEDSTFGGAPLIPHLSHPRALDDAGNPRFDVFVLILKNFSDMDRFQVGESYEFVE
jgi:hypothetical protein